MRVYCTLSHDSWHPVLGHLVPGEQELSITTAKAQVAVDSLLRNGILRGGADPVREEPEPEAAQPSDDDQEEPVKGEDVDA